VRRHARNQTHFSFTRGFSSVLFPWLIFNFKELQQRDRDRLFVMIAGSRLWTGSLSLLIYRQGSGCLAGAGTASNQRVRAKKTAVAILNFSLAVYFLVRMQTESFAKI
jgi:hypothetical protein